MALRDRLRRAERLGGISRVECTACGRQWLADEWLEADLLTAAWAQELQARGEDAECSYRLSRVAQAILEHEHSWEDLVVVDSGKKLCEDLVEAWSEGWPK